MPLPSPWLIATRAVGWVAEGTRTIARGGRERWVEPASDRVHIEMRGLRHPGAESQVRRALLAHDRVRRVEINAVLGVVVLWCDQDDDHLIDELVGVVREAERTHGVASRNGVAGSDGVAQAPALPGARAEVVRETVAFGATLAGFGAATVGRIALGDRRSLRTAITASLVDSTPALRARLESLVGPRLAAALLVHGGVGAHVLAQLPTGLFVDACRRLVLLRAAQARQREWAKWDAALSLRPGSHEAAAIPYLPRPAPLEPSAAERMADRIGLLALLAYASALALTGKHSRALGFLAAGVPKAARFGQESFAAGLGAHLAERGILVLDPTALRRMDRVDTVVIDAAVLATHNASPGEILPLDDHLAADLPLRAHELVNAANAGTASERDGWATARLGNPQPNLSADARSWVRTRTSEGADVLAIRRGPDTVGLVSVVPELDPLAEALVTAAKSVGTAVLAGTGSRLDRRLPFDQVVAGGNRLRGSVRALQEDGHVVALVSARQRSALAAADIGIGLTDDTKSSTRQAGLNTDGSTRQAGLNTDGSTRQAGLAAAERPWGAHVFCPGLAQACVLLDAVIPARQVSERSALLAVGGTMTAGVTAVVGPARGAARRASIPVNLAALIAMADGVWAGRAAARAPTPARVERIPWHSMPAMAVLDRLGSSMRGITTEEATQRDSHGGAQPEVRGDGLVQASIRELATPLTPALAAGAGLSAALGSVADAAMIVSALGINAVLGGTQRVRGDRALRELIDASAVPVRLHRDGRVAQVQADQLVPGDVVELTAGDAVPADCRLLDTHGLEVDESSLTGESALIHKTATETVAEAVADRQCMLYQSTAVAAGRGRAVVVAVGEQTEVGRTARIGAGEAPESAAQSRLRALAKVTVPLSLAAGALLLGTDLLRGRGLSQAVGHAVGLSVTAIPEGLPFVAKSAELAAARRLSRRGALVHNPAAMEMLGRVNVLCFDKTGTLTQGRIALRRVSDGATNAAIEEITPQLRRVLAAGRRASPRRTAEQPLLAHPTDRAVVEGAARYDIAVDEDVPGWHQVAELPFEPSRGYHAVLGRGADGQRVSVKGAPETVLARCATWRHHGAESLFDSQARARVEREVDGLARHGYRVLAVAERAASDRTRLQPARIRALSLVGLLALGDPVRPTAARSVEALRRAGVDVVMITGDHPSTAEAIAAELNALNGRQVMTGPELDAMNDDELAARLPGVAVFARVSPEQKARIIRALRRAGRRVAVTGDGANDAPAIRLADIGIALGSRATPAARQAADMVVTDDRIETITDAVVEGRAMWSSVRDGLAILLGGNLGEIGFTLGAGLLGADTLNVRQLLMVNLFTDVLPAMAVAVRPPAHRTAEALLAEGPETSLGAALTRDVAVRAVATATAANTAWLAARLTAAGRRASTTALVALVGAQLGQTMTVRGRTPLVLISSLATLGALAVMVQTPGLSQFCGCLPLWPHQWAFALGSATATTAAVTLATPLLNRNAKGHNAAG